MVGPGINELKNLEVLDLGYNLIKRVVDPSHPNLKGLSALHTLRLSNNLLYRSEDMVLIKNALCVLVLRCDYTT